MRILVLSLLRIGDIVLSAPVLRGLRSKYPDAHIDVVVNSQFLQAANLVPYVDRWIGFDRDRLQKSLGSAQAPLFDAYHGLSDWLDELGGEKYDMAINLTHNRLSGWMMSLIDAEKRIGLCFDTQGRGTFGSSWFRHLNAQVDAESEDAFHFTDIFRFALGLQDESMAVALEPTTNGEFEAQTFLEKHGVTSTGLRVGGECLVVQALTSDEKKNWGLKHFSEAIEIFSQRHPSALIAVVGAEFERAALEPFVTSLQAKNLKVELAILSFEGAFSLLRNAKLVLTGDTSIKHLAAAARTPVVELGLGSADHHRTGAYQHGSIILQSLEACAPCVHSKACHRDSHACATRLSSDIVGMVTAEVFAGRTFQLSTIAEECAGEVEILRVDTKTCGYWIACPVRHSFTEESVARHLDRASRKLWLQAIEGREMSTELGTEIRHLAEVMRKLYPKTSPVEWRHLLDSFESQGQMTEARVNGFKTGIRVLHGSFEDAQRLTDFVKGLISFREKIRHSPSLRSFKTALDSVIEDDISPAFTRLRRIVDTVGEIETRTTINLRLLRGLEQEMGHEVDHIHGVEFT